MVLGKTADALLKRKKLLGLIFLAVGALLWIRGYDVTTQADVSSLSFVAFIFLLLGVVFLMFGLQQKRRTQYG